MSTTPKWYCRNKSQPMHMFAELTKLGQDLRRITKRLVIDVKVDIFSEHDTLLDECEQIVDQYWSLKDNTTNKDFQSLSKKIKRSPYNTLLMHKFHVITELNDRRFCQLTFVLKKTLSFLLRKSLQSEVWMNWALQITELYNKCRKPLVDSTENGSPKLPDEQMNANICSNMYPALLLPYKRVDFASVLQEAWRDTNESNCSSLEILRILTLNLTSDGDFQQFYTEQTNRDYSALTLTPEPGSSSTKGSSVIHMRSKHIEYFLHNERSFVKQFIEKAYDISPTIFGQASNENLHEFVLQGMRLMWSYVGIILDHIILWWIDTPISCYSLAHVNSIRKWLFMQNVNDVPEPIYSTLQGVAEILTNFVSNNLWDRLFRLTLMTASANEHNVEQFLDSHNTSPTNNFGTNTGTVWIAIFNNLIDLSNNYFHSDDVSNSSLLPVAEQIPILHRIDHTVHCLRIWVKEESKKLCGKWKMHRYFQIHEHDVRLCLKLFEKFKLPKLTADLSDILMLKTTEECVQILSDICRLLSLANFTLCFPPTVYWQKASFDNDKKSDYVGYVLDQIYLPCIKATKDISILKLILKLICEAWLDFIYQRQIRFSVNGAVRLLNDFDEVREWLLSCPLLDAEHLEKLSNHEVLRMCKGVGKILLRKPEDIISIAQTPKFEKRLGDSAANAQDTQLPSEMFVSNQKHWLQLRASKSSITFLPFCCKDSSI
uniref:Coiled-coil protein 142 C-terminal domain-containing protein n=1 Tax=Glossina pallidipes TaxID=7398 RepID=A0A1A9ZHN7_GLOPL